MSKTKKVKILEILILITIIISLVIVIWLTYSYFNNKITESTSSNIENYSYNKITLYEEDIDVLEKYNVPYIDNIDKDNSYYRIYIKSTDNYIKGYTEIIVLYYKEAIEEINDTEETSDIEETNDIEETSDIEETNDFEEITYKEIDKKQIKSYCNGHNLIEHGYVLSCKYDDNHIVIKNDITLPVDLIKKNNLPVLFEEDQKLNEYLKELDEREIPHKIVNEIK